MIPNNYVLDVSKDFILQTLHVRQLKFKIVLNKFLLLNAKLVKMDMESDYKRMEFNSVFKSTEITVLLFHNKNPSLV